MPCRINSMSFPFAVDLEGAFGTIGIGAWYWEPETD